MYLIRYCGQWNYRPQAESLSALINLTLPDTCEIEEGKIGQFDVFLSGEYVASKEELGRFVEFDDVLRDREERGLDEWKCRKA